MPSWDEWIDGEWGWPPRIPAARLALDEHARMADLLGIVSLGPHAADVDEAAEMFVGEVIARSRHRALGIADPLRRVMEAAASELDVAAALILGKYDEIDVGDPAACSVAASTIAPRRRNTGEAFHAYRQGVSDLANSQARAAAWLRATGAGKRGPKVDHALLRLFGDLLFAMKQVGVSLKLPSNEAIAANAGDAIANRPTKALSGLEYLLKTIAQKGARIVQAESDMDSRWREKAMTEFEVYASLSIRAILDSARQARREFFGDLNK